MPSDSGSSERPVLPFGVPPPMPRTPNEAGSEVLLDRLALEIVEELEARLPGALTDEGDHLALTAALVGFGAARLLPPERAREVQSDTPATLDTMSSWVPGEIIREVRDDDLVVLASSFLRGPVVDDEWGMARALDRQQDFAVEVIPCLLIRLAALVPEGVLAWLDPSLPASLDSAAAVRLRSRDLMTTLRTVSLNAFRRVTQGQKLVRSEDQLFAAARKDRKRALEPTADDAVGDALVAALTSTYEGWLERESPPPGVAMLVAARVIVTTAELRGIHPDIIWGHAPVLVSCLRYLRRHFALEDWYAYGRAGFASWHPEAARYWTEGLAALVPSLSEALRDARRRELATDGPVQAPVSSVGDDPMVLTPGMTVKGWQERLRARVQSQERELQAREGEEARRLAELRAEHARALAAAEGEQARLRQRAVQAEQAMAVANDSLRRVEQDAQRAMRRVVQLEQALEEQRALAPAEGASDAEDVGERDSEEPLDELRDILGEDSRLPADCFAGRRVLVFTGRERLGVHEQIAERFRRLGADEVQVRLSHRDHGLEVIDARDCVVIDLAFAGHSDTGAIRANAMSVGAWVFAAKLGVVRLAEEAGRAWLEHGE